MRGWIVCSVLVALVGCGASVPQTGGGGGGGGGRYTVARLEAPGAFFLAGGGNLAPLTLQRFVEQAGGRGAPIVVVPFAGGAAEGDRHRQAFEALGAQVTVLTGAAERREAELAAMRGANGLYFPGGLVEKLLSDMGPFEAAARAAWLSGCVIGGSSAGAMAWGDRVIVRGEAEAVSAAGLDEAKGGAAIRPGLGLLSGTIVDPHFRERGRLHRLWLAAGETGRLGLGLDEDTAVVVTGSGTVRVVGPGTVTLIRPEGGADASARMTILKQGQEANWADWAMPDARSGE